MASTETEAPEPRVYSLGIRTLWVKARRLEVHHGYGPPGEFCPPEEGTAAPAVNTWITATARTADGIAEIGSTTPPSRAFTLYLRPMDAETLARRWPEHWDSVGSLWRLHEDAPPAEMQARLYVETAKDRFDARPPSFAVGFIKGDWELGSSDEWFMEAAVPRPILEAIVEDATAGRCDLLDLGVELNPPLLDDRYAPPSVSVTFGVVPHAGDGWVSSLSWRHPAPAAHASRRRRRKPVKRREKVMEPGHREDAAAAAAALRELATTVRRGFVLVFALVVLAILLRLL